MEHPVTPVGLYFDDIQVGDIFDSASHQLDAEQIIAFASAFDPQPFHLDDALARDTLFAGLAASGWHTAAITMRLLVQSLPLAQGLIGAGAEISWPRPTRATDCLRVQTTVREKTASRSKPDRGIVVIESITINQQGDILQKLVSKAVCFKRPA